MELNDKDFRMLAVCSVRYALGRRTYMPSWVCQVLKPRVEHLADGDVDCLIRDIETPPHSTDETRANQKAWGDNCDYVEWMGLLEILKAEREKRKALTSG